MLHAVQLECVKFLVEQRGAPVNQKDLGQGWTPLHRCAQMAHHTHAPYMEIFEYLLQNGADGRLLSSPSGLQVHVGHMSARHIALCCALEPVDSAL